MSKIEIQIVGRRKYLMSKLEIQIVGRVEGSLGSKIRRRLKAPGLFYSPAPQYWVHLHCSQHSAFEGGLGELHNRHLYHFMKSSSPELFGSFRLILFMNWGNGHAVNKNTFLLKVNIIRHTSLLEIVKILDI